MCSLYFFKFVLTFIENNLIGYYSFGMVMPGRNANSGNYKYGFNGKENDNEWNNNQGGWQDYGMRMYDPRLCRFPSVDPITKSYPELTPYQFASNTPISCIDLDGLEKKRAPLPPPLPKLKRHSKTADTKSSTTYVWSHATNTAPPPKPMPSVTYGPISGTDELTFIFTLTLEYFTGTGPVQRTINDGPISQHFKDSRKVEEARNYWYIQANQNRNMVSNPVTGYGGDFGLTGLVDAGGDLVEQFVGTYRIASIEVVDNGKSLKFMLTNRTSTNSLLYDIGPSWNRTSFPIMGNTYQTYIFTEPIDFSLLPGQSAEKGYVPPKEKENSQKTSNEKNDLELEPDKLDRE